MSTKGDSYPKYWNYELILIKLNALDSVPFQLFVTMADFLTRKIDPKYFQQGMVKIGSRHIVRTSKVGLVARVPE